MSVTLPTDTVHGMRIITINGDITVVSVTVVDDAVNSGTVVGDTV